MHSKNLRKILQVGCRKAVSLPLDWIREMDLNKGKSVNVLFDTVAIVKPRQINVDFDALKQEWEIANRGKEL